MTAHHKISAFSVVSRAGRAALLGTVFGASLASAAMAVEITVWSGYPEMVPFYEHVAEGIDFIHIGRRISIPLPTNAGQSSYAVENGVPIVRGNGTKAGRTPGLHLLAAPVVLMLIEVYGCRSRRLRCHLALDKLTISIERKRVPDLGVLPNPVCVASD